MAYLEKSLHNSLLQLLWTTCLSNIKPVKSKMTSVFSFYFFPKCLHIGYRLVTFTLIKHIVNCPFSRVCHNIHNLRSLFSHMFLFRIHTVLKNYAELNIP